MLEPVRQDACLMHSSHFGQSVNTVGRKQEPKALVGFIENLILDGLVSASLNNFREVGTIWLSPKPYPS